MCPTSVSCILADLARGRSASMPLPARRPTRGRLFGACVHANGAGNAHQGSGLGIISKHGWLGRFTKFAPPRRPQRIARGDVDSDEWRVVGAIKRTCCVGCRTCYTGFTPLLPRILLTLNSRLGTPRQGSDPKENASSSGGIGEVGWCRAMWRSYTYKDVRRAEQGHGNGRLNANPPLPLCPSPGPERLPARPPSPPPILPRTN